MPYWPGSKYLYLTLFTFWDLRHFKTASKPSGADSWLLAKLNIKSMFSNNLLHWFPVNCPPYRSHLSRPHTVVQVNILKLSRLYLKFFDKGQIYDWITQEIGEVHLDGKLLTLLFLQARLTRDVNTIFELFCWHLSSFVSMLYKLSCNFYTEF